MEQQKRSLYEILAKMAGEDPQNIKIQMEHALDRIVHSKEIVIISESFPCPPSYHVPTKDNFQVDDENKLLWYEA